MPDIIKPKNEKANIIATIVIIGFIASVFFHYVQGYYFNKSYPYNTFLFNPGDFFNDFYNVYREISTLKPYSSNLIAYFPFSVVIIYFFTYLNANSALCLMIALFISLLFVQNYFYVLKNNQDVYTRVQKTIILTLLPYPFLFVLDRSNIEIVMYIFMSLFVLFYYKFKSNICQIFLACAISMKLFPILFVAIFISNKEYKKAAYTLLLSAGITLISYWVIGLFSGDGFTQTISLHLKNLSAFNDSKLSLHGLQHSHTIWNMLVISASYLTNSTFDLRALANYYTYIVLTLLIIFMTHIIFIEKTEWKKLTLCVVAMISFNTTSFDYTLISLYLPVILFVNELKNSKLDIVHSILFGLMLIPLDYYYITNTAVSSSVFLFPFIMTVLSATIIIPGIYNYFTDAANIPVYDVKEYIN